MKDRTWLDRSEKTEVDEPGLPPARLGSSGKPKPKGKPLSEQHRRQHLPNKESPRREVGGGLASCMRKCDIITPQRIDYATSCLWQLGLGWR
jgi:hypothetical protein